MVHRSLYICPLTMLVQTAVNLEPTYILHQTLAQAAPLIATCSLTGHAPRVTVKSWQPFL